MVVRLAKKEDEEELIRLTMENLPEFYDGHTPDFAKSLLKTHLNQKEDYGFFFNHKSNLGRRKERECFEWYALCS